MSSAQYRFLACRDYGEEFKASVSKHGDSPPRLERYQQERSLFGFFVSGLSALECLGYGLFAAGALLHSIAFPISSDNEKQAVKLEAAEQRFRVHFTSDPITSWLTNLIAANKYQRWKSVRNVLAHRQAPGRRFNVTVGDPTRVTEWIGEPLDPNMVDKRRPWLVDQVWDGLSALSDFTASRF